MEFERRGIPTVTLVSRPFVALANARAAGLGLAGLPIESLPHPLAGRDRSELAQLAEAHYGAIVAAITSDDPHDR